MRWLDERDIEYEKIDVIADEAAFDEMIRLSGQELAPVIDVDGEVLADFGPDQLESFGRNWRRRMPGLNPAELKPRPRLPDGCASGCPRPTASPRPARCWTN